MKVDIFLRPEEAMLETGEKLVFIQNLSSVFERSIQSTLKQTE